MIFYATHGDGEPLVWLHGHMGLGSDWQYIFDDVPPGFRLIAPDLRGHGQSPGEEPVYSFEQSARDVLEILDDLRIARVKLMGLSGGGITALHIAALQPSRVAAMVIVSAPPAFPEQARAIQRGFSAAMLGEEEVARMRVRHPRPGQVDALIAQVRAMAEGDDPNFTSERLAAITADTLIVFGDRDPLYPVSLALDLRRSIPSSWLWVIPNGGHAPVFGPAAPRFKETALGFLANGFS